MNKYLELLGCIVLIVFFFWWLISNLYRTSLIAIIYWKDGKIEESNLLFENLEQYDEWVEQMYRDYPDKIYHITYTFINPKHKKQ